MTVIEDARGRGRRTKPMASIDIEAKANFEPAGNSVIGIGIANVGGKPVLFQIAQAVVIERLTERR